MTLLKFSLSAFAKIRATYISSLKYDWCNSNFLINFKSDSRKSFYSEKTFILKPYFRVYFILFCFLRRVQLLSKSQAKAKNVAMKLFAIPLNKHMYIHAKFQKVSFKTENQVYFEMMHCGTNQPIPRPYKWERLG